MVVRYSQLNKFIIRKVSLGFFGFAVIWVFFSLSFLKLGSYFYNQNNYIYATKFYKLSGFLLPFWGLPGKRLSAINQLDQLKKQSEERKSREVAVSDDSVTVTGKKISNIEQGRCVNCPGVLVTAIFKNKLEIGIPTVQISKINLLKNGKVIAFKKLSKEFFIVSGGEFPFKIFLSNREKALSFDDFQLEFQIPPFIPDTNVVRLKKVETTTESVLAHTNDAVYLKYKVTILNDSNCAINNIYRIAFLKYGDYIFDEYRSTARVFVKEEPPKSDAIDLDNKEKVTYQRLTIEPGGQKDVSVDLMIDSMVKGLYDLNDVRLESYFIGVKAKDCF